MQYVVDVFIRCVRLRKRHMVGFAAVTDRHKPAARLNQVFAVVVQVLDRCPPIRAGVRVGPYHDNSSQSSHTLYAAVTLPRSGSMKCSRCDGVAEAASITPA